MRRSKNKHVALAHNANELPCRTVAFPNEPRSLVLMVAFAFGLALQVLAALALDNFFRRAASTASKASVFRQPDRCHPCSQQQGQDRCAVAIFAAR